MVGNWIFPLDHENTVCRVSMSRNQWERISCKTTLYSMILTNSTKWVSSQLFRCCRAKLGPIGRTNLQHLSFITKLLLVWPVVKMDPHLKDWITKSSQVPWTGNLPSWMWHLNLQSHSQYPLLYVTRWQKNGERFLKDLQKTEGHFEITQTAYHRCFHSIWIGTCEHFSSRIFPFWFWT